MADLLQKSDIVTMRKDIKNARKAAPVLSMPKMATAKEQPAMKKPVQETPTENEMLNKIFEQTARQRQSLEQQKKPEPLKAAPEPIKKLETNPPEKLVTQKPVSQQLESEPTDNLEPRPMKAPAVSHAHEEKPTPEPAKHMATQPMRAPAEPQKPLATKAAAPAQPIQPLAIKPFLQKPAFNVQKPLKENTPPQQPAMTEQERRKKLMDEIEQWATQTKK